MCVLLVLAAIVPCHFRKKMLKLSPQDHFSEKA